MKPASVKELRTREQAVKELGGYHKEYAKKPEGQRLTLKIIREGVGARESVTISRWLNGHNKPYGAYLDNLCAFLDKCKNRKWLEQFIRTFNGQ